MQDSSFVLSITQKKQKLFLKICKSLTININKEREIKRT